MLPVINTRIIRPIIRKRWVLLVIFVLSLIYFIVNTFPSIRGRMASFDSDGDLLAVKKSTVFHWSKFDRMNSTALKTCRNSVQGKQLLADEQGYVCERPDLLTGGCCNPQGLTTQHYICESCLDNNCCSVYEHCISCCLQPDKQPLLRKILGKASDTFNHLFASVTDHFELCLAKCRTSSQSVQHENSYRDPKAKYCFGEDPPDLHPGRMR